MIPLLLADGEKVSAVQVDTGGVMGLNSRGGLAAVERVVRERINAAHMANGVTLVDPATTYIDVDVDDRPRLRDPPDDLPGGLDPRSARAARSARRRGSSTRPWATGAR